MSTPQDLLFAAMRLNGENISGDPTGETFFESQKQNESKPSDSSPLVVSADNADDYLNNPYFGDKVLDAILKGRQILVRTPNADGGKYTAIYSPILMYQLPNFENKYLYLFYLRDEKQDLSPVLGVDIKMPVYGELKLLLSKTYNKSPLD